MLRFVVQFALQDGKAPPAEREPLQLQVLPFMLHSELSARLQPIGSVSLVSAECVVLTALQYGHVELSYACGPVTCQDILTFAEYFTSLAQMAACRGVTVIIQYARIWSFGK